VKYDRRQCRDVRVTSSLDEDSSEARGLCALRGDPERQFNRAWALAMLKAVLARMKREYCSWGNDGAERARRFDVVKGFLQAEPSAEQYAAAGAELDTEAAAVKQLVHRLRQKFPILLREEVARLVGNPAEIELEIAFLRESLEIPPDGAA
jgi:RNA polymerase sigma-70 factor (ECF subfamily)